MIIGITGRAQSGKSTIADYLLSILPGYEIDSFAAPLKAMLRAGFGLTSTHTDGAFKETILPDFGVSPRKMMQTLGTEWGRHMIHKDIWVIVAEQNPNNMRIFSDVRFENEAAFIRRNGILIHVERNSALNMDHESENGVIPDVNDYFINNNGGLQMLFDQVDSIMQSAVRNKRKSV